MSPIIVFAVVGILALIILGAVTLFAKFYVKVEQGKALIVNKMRPEPEVTFTGMIVMPIFHKSEIMDISVKTIEIDRRGKEGLICRDNIRADIKVTFFVRVNKTRDDVVKVAQSIGCARASDPKTLEELFSAKFSEALKTVGKQLDFVDLYTKRDEFRDRIVEVIGRDLNGYVLEDAAIDYLEQTPLNSLDSHNILDAQGIRKITELTTIEHIRTNEYTNNGKKQIKKQDVEAAEAILELERQQADATAKQKREIETVIAREQAEIQKVQAEERLKSELARIKSEEEIAINEQNKQRQVEVAQKNRERVVVVETERVKREQAVEAIAREREVELQRIAKEKDLEEQRKAIAEVTCERIAVDKTVAEQEEVIKALRVVEEAKRIREAAVITAEGEAQEKLIKDLKAAEGAEMASKFKVKEKLAFAEAEYEIADKQAKARLRMAEGVQAEAAAAGLAQVKVKDAEAQVLEKYGLAEAKVMREKGAAEAQVIRDKGTTEAEVKLGIGTTEAQNLRNKGLAEAEVTRQRFESEAAGISQKAEAMKILDEASRIHEEFRLRLENERILELQALQAQQAIAEAQAKVLAAALHNAKIDIVGGDALFSQRILNGITLGKTIEGVVNRSETAQGLVSSVQTMLENERGLPVNLKDLTLAGILTYLLSNGIDDGKKARLQELLEAARDLGVDNLKVG